jgi:MFS family permease
MQFLFIPIWGRLSDRVGRRPVLLWSIAASAVGMALLAVSGSIFALLLARVWSGVATANIAVAQAYIADVTTPETRAKGMGLIGMGFGLGFIIGPFVGGVLGQFHVLSHEGSLAALVAAGLSVVNFFCAYGLLPESHPVERRGQRGGVPGGHVRRSPFDLEAVRKVVRLPGLGVALAIGFSVTFWFSGLEVTFRLFTEDAFGLGIAGTGYIFGFVGVIAVIVQGGLIHRLSKRFGEVRLIQFGLVALAIGFGVDAVSPRFGLSVLLLGSALIALGNGLYTPSLSSYTSRQSGPEVQGLSLGVVQSMAALARVLGPVTGGLAYQYVGKEAPYALGALGVLGVALLALRLPALPARAAAARATAAAADRDADGEGLAGEPAAAPTP